MCMPHPFSLVRMGPPTAATRISDGSKTPSRDCMRGIPHIKNLLYQAGGSHTKKRRCNESVVGTFGSRRHGERHQRSERHEYGGEAPHGWRGQGWGGGRPAATNGLYTYISDFEALHCRSRWRIPRASGGHVGVRRAAGVLAPRRGGQCASKVSEPRGATGRAAGWPSAAGAVDVSSLERNRNV